MNNINNKNNKNIIIHISGASGVGKTTMGTQLKKKFGKNIVVKDTDDLMSEFISSIGGKFINFDSIKYQNYIDNFINKQTKPIIFVGLYNVDVTKEPYNMRSTYNFYITLDKNIIFIQRCNRLFKKYLLNKDSNNFKSKLKNACDYDLIMKQINEWDNYYKKYNFLFLSKEKIITKVSQLIIKYKNKTKLKTKTKIKTKIKTKTKTKTKIKIKTKTKIKTNIKTK